MTSSLALHGGKKLISKPLQSYNSIGKEEELAANTVVKSGVLSKFLGEKSSDFYGGPYVQKFEKDWSEFFNVKHSITVNSWTSGLIAAVGSLGLEPGDEVILSPWTMCACASSILHWNLIPVFADIEDKTFNLDPKSILQKINSKTKAIMTIDIFGHSSNISEINKIAIKHNLKVIADTAQSPMALYKNKYAGTLTDIGGYSLNYHKHIHTGEGGVIVTNDDDLAEKMKLIRNHGEAVVKEPIPNIIGYNFRLGEIEAAIGIQQLKKLKYLVQSRQKAAEYLTSKINKLDGLRTPYVNVDCTHVYYVYPIVIDTYKIGVKREKIVEALIAEGLEVIGNGYSLLHLMPIFQKKIAYGSNSFPWSMQDKNKSTSYDLGICPVAEKLHFETFICFEMCVLEMSIQDINLIADVFYKVWDNLDQLKK